MVDIFLVAILYTIYVYNVENWSWVDFLREFRQQE